MSKLAKIKEAVHSKACSFAWSVNNFAENHIGIWYAICTGFGLLIGAIIILLTRKSKTYGNLQKKWFRKIYGWDIK